MSVASTLYGVTMQEQGVSKRVAVKFDTKGNAIVHAPGAPRQAAETARSVRRPLTLQANEKGPDHCG